jgi:hypothetical protein|tara:strand:+ start:223 stop:330 length:108 start_codon:yes stop_codon:yes gene_type:complete
MKAGKENLMFVMVAPNTTKVGITQFLKRRIDNGLY